MYLNQIRKLPPGILSKVIQAAHRIAGAKLENDFGRSAEYAAYKVMYYDESTWYEAMKECNVVDINFVDNSDKGFPVKLETDPRWPEICNNDCPFERECANAGSAGDYRSECGLTPDFVKNDDGSIICYGCGDTSRGMRLFEDDGTPTTYYEKYFKDEW